MNTRKKERVHNRSVVNTFDGPAPNQPIRAEVMQSGVHTRSTLNRGGMCEGAHGDLCHGILMKLPVYTSNVKVRTGILEQVPHDPTHSARFRRQASLIRPPWSVPPPFSVRLPSSIRSFFTLRPAFIAEAWRLYLFPLSSLPLAALPASGSFRLAPKLNRGTADRHCR